MQLLFGQQFLGGAKTSEQKYFFSFIKFNSLVCQQHIVSIHVWQQSTKEHAAQTFSSGLLKTYVKPHLPQYWRSKWDAMNTPAPHSSLGHSRRRRVIFPLSSTWDKHHFTINHKEFTQWLVFTVYSWTPQFVKTVITANYYMYNDTHCTWKALRMTRTSEHYNCNSVPKQRIFGHLHRLFGNAQV